MQMWHNSSKIPLQSWLNITRHFIAVFLFTLTTSAYGQQDPQAEHLSHHPELAAQATAVAGSSGQSPAANINRPPVQPPGAAGMMSQMGDMMKNMGVPPKKDFYPSLVDVPELSLERWNEVQQQAHKRMTEGLNQLSRGLGSLSAAVESDNFATMQQSLDDMQEGLTSVKSGLSAHRLLAEGEAPRNVAMSWLKSEMNLETAKEEEQKFLWGFSFFHLAIMALLLAFSVSMIVMYFFKMHRASILIERLITEGVANRNPPPTTDGTNSPPSNNSPPTTATSSNNPGNSSQNLSETPQTSAKLWAGKLKVQKIVKESNTVKTFTFVDPQNDELPFQYLPGQFLTLSASIDGRSVARSYTIASSPLNRTFCELSIKREDQGTFSRYLHDLIKVGDTVYAKGPSGLFVFTGAESPSIVLIGAGIGVTPMMSVLRYLISKSWQGRIILLFSCRDISDYLFRDELEALARKTPNFKLLVTLTGNAAPGWNGLQGRVSKQLIQDKISDICTARIHLCGPIPFMDGIKKILLELGVSSESIKTESFGSMRRDEPSTPLGRDGQNTIINTSTTVTFLGSHKVAALPPNLSVLEAAESVGVAIDNTCRAGTCGICKVRLRTGSVTMEIQDGLTAEDKQNGFILACQAKSTENIGVEA